MREIINQITPQSLKGTVNKVNYEKTKGKGVPACLYVIHVCKGMKVKGTK